MCMYAVCKRRLDTVKLKMIVNIFEVNRWLYLTLFSSGSLFCGSFYRSTLLNPASSESPPAPFYNLSKQLLAVHSSLGFLGDTVGAHDHSVVPLIGLQSKLLSWFELLLLQLLNLTGKHSFRGCRGVDATSFDGNDEVASSLQEILCVQPEDTSLIWLSYVSKHHVAHTHKHTVSLWVTSVLDNGDNVCALFGHVDELATRPL
mmetsp:Transcript_25861/g.31374  ORF Transcript_25861/g.31374 Transcript_25861/m.31374 type:complete len:203 (-) Transcript_25861:596-1204(-)